MDRLLNVIEAFSIVMMVLVLISVRRAHIRVEYSVSWLTAAVTMLIISRNGPMLQHASDLIGITYVPAALLYILFCVFLVVFCRFSIRISEMKDANIALAQRLAILEYQLRSSHEKQFHQSNPS